MSNISDFSVLTRSFVQSNHDSLEGIFTDLDHSGVGLCVIPLTTQMSLREALDCEITLNDTWNTVQLNGEDFTLEHKLAVKDDNGNFIGNVIRVKPDKSAGSVRVVAKVAPIKGSAAIDAVEEGDGDIMDAKTFILCELGACAQQVKAIAVASLEAGYKIKCQSVESSIEAEVETFTGTDPALDACEGAQYVSFTIHTVNGYRSVDFNPDAYTTYDVIEEVYDAIEDVQEQLLNKDDLRGLHIAFDPATGDLKLYEADGRMIDQANLQMSGDTVIAEGEEGYKYVKTDINQDIHSAKGFTSIDNGTRKSMFGDVAAVGYTPVAASLMKLEVGGGSPVVSNGIRVYGTNGLTLAQTVAWVDYSVYYYDDDIHVSMVPYASDGSPISGGDDSCSFPSVGNLPASMTSHQTAYDYTSEDATYNHDVFVHTVGKSTLQDWDYLFKCLGFHVGDDIALGTNLPALFNALSDAESEGEFDHEAYIHGTENGNDNEARVNAQRSVARTELVAWNAAHPALTFDPTSGTLVDSQGIDIRNGSIRLSDGAQIGPNGESSFTNFELSVDSDPELGHDGLKISMVYAAQNESADLEDSYSNGRPNPALETSAELLRITPKDYISGAPTCLVLAQASDADGLMIESVRTTAGFELSTNYEDEQDGDGTGWHLIVTDNRENILRALQGDLGSSLTSIPTLVEIQAIYSAVGDSQDAIPAPQMYSVVGEWDLSEDEPVLDIICNKLEDWAHATDLSGSNVTLYIIIKVY